MKLFHSKKRGFSPGNPSKQDILVKSCPNGTVTNFNMLTEAWETMSCSSWGFMQFYWAVHDLTFEGDLQEFSNNLFAKNGIKCQINVLFLIS